MVDTQHVIRVAGGDGVPALPGAERHMNVNDIVVAAASAQQSYAARDVRRHDGDVDVPRLQQPDQADLTGTAPRLRDGANGNADGTPAPQGLIQAGLHGDRLARVIKRKKRTGVEGESGCRARRHPASLSSRLGWPVRPTRSSSP